jgi:hypothetical protein
MTVTLTPEQVVTTPTVRSLARTSRFWIAAAVVIVLAIVGYNFLTPPAVDGAPLSADGTGQTGAKALVSVLREHGVSVSPTTSLRATASASVSKQTTTIFAYDPSDFLDADQRAQLATMAAHIVVLSPTTAALADFAPQLASAGAATSTMAAHCELPAAVRANTITDGGHAYRLKDAAGTSHACFPTGARGFALVQLPSTNGDLTVVGTTKTFTNEFIGDRGNAALAINLLGSTPNLVWYLPSIEDVGAGGHTESIANAAPRWIEPLLILALLVVIAAGAWRGRRFGPLVVERLPVIVRASETMEGRARLYQASSARLRALDALRMGTVQRVASLCGLSRRASLDEIIGAAAAATGRTPDAVRNLLVDDHPGNDSDLVRLSDDLLVFERDVAAATLPS